MKKEYDGKIHVLLGVGSDYFPETRDPLPRRVSTLSI
ncbi:hypothetical protein BSAF29S_01400 [Bacillus safensis subsp. safensis]